MRNRLLALLLLLAAAALGLPATASADGRVTLVVTQETELGAAQRADVRADAGVLLDRRLSIPGAETVTVDAVDAATAEATLARDPRVTSVARDAKLFHTFAGTVDPFFGSQWALRNTGQTIAGSAGVAQADVDAVGAWAKATGRGIRIAEVDSGVDKANTDLQGRLDVNAVEKNGLPGVDDDGNGLVDDVTGWDFLGNDADVTDGNGHGTAVATTAVATNGDGAGMSGVAPEATVLPIRALDNTGQGTLTDVANAIDYAGDRGARIVNLSLGAESGPVPVVEQAIAAHPNMLVVVAAGNAGADVDSRPFYPCVSPQPNVICVGASTNRDAVWASSNVGAQGVDLFAPGEDIVASGLNEAYGYWSGTSLAAPVVSGVAALTLQAVPGLTGQQLKRTLMATADRLPSMTGKSVTGARVDAAAAVGAAPDDTPDEQPQTAVPGRGSVVQTPSTDSAGDSAATPAVSRRTSVTTRSSGSDAASAPDATTATTLRIDRATAGRCSGRRCLRRIRVALATSASTRVRVSLQRKVCRSGSCRWRAVGKAARVTVDGRRALSMRERLPAARYRVVARGAGTMVSRALRTR